MSEEDPKIPEAEDSSEGLGALCLIGLSVAAIVLVLVIAFVTAAKH